MTVEVDTSVGTDLTKDEILDLLSTNDEDEHKDETDEEKEARLAKEEEGETDEEKTERERKEKEEKDKLELKEDEEEDEIDDEKLVTPARRKEILKTFPDLFKKFPYLETAYYRDQKFVELFATVEDAEEASGKAEMLDGLHSQLSEGNTESILKSVKENDPEAFKKLVDNYLPTLASIDQEAYFHVLGVQVKNLIISMAAESKKTDNKQLQTAAQLVNQFVFGTSEFELPANLSTDSGDKDGRSKLDKDREEFDRQRFETARNDLSSKINNVLKSTVDAHIDPRSHMTAYVKKQATRDTMEAVDTAIQSDGRFTKILDDLWKKAAGANFSPASVNKIRSTYLSKAKTVLPSAIKKVRRESLQGLSSKGKADEEDRKGPASKERRHTSTSSSRKSEDGKGMSTVDFFNQD